MSERNEAGIRPSSERGPSGPVPLARGAEEMISSGPRNKVRVAIAGVGNCASSLVQGVEFYRDADPAERVPGLMHVDLGGYHVRDIEFSAAFDIDAEKVGKDLSEAIFSGQNNTLHAGPSDPGSPWVPGCGPGVPKRFVTTGNLLPLTRLKSNAGPPRAITRR